MSINSFAYVSAGLAYNDVPGVGGGWPPEGLAFYGISCTLTVLSIALYALVAVYTCVLAERTEGHEAMYRKRMLLLGGAVVVLSSYRAVLPVQDLERIVWFDTPLSSILVLRVTTVLTELCFVAQLAYATGFCAHQVHQARAELDLQLAHDVSTGAGFCEHYSQLASGALFMLVCVAEGVTSVGVVIGNCRLFVWAEAMWGVAVMVCCPAFAFICYQALQYNALCRVAQVGSSSTSVSIFGACAFLLGGVYAAFIFAVDTPRWWSAHMESMQHGVPSLSFADGLQDALILRVQTRSREVWGLTALWLLIYTPILNGFAIFLSSAPRIAEAKEAHSLIGARTGPRVFVI